MNNTIAASILGHKDKKNLINKIVSKGINWIHYDVMDGIFVSNTSLPTEEIMYLKNNCENHIVDVHLMVNDPLKYLIELNGFYDFITFHYESESIDNIRKIFKKFSNKRNIGIAIKPKTNIEQIFEFLPDCSHVLVMTVEPGEGGQLFDENMLEKIKKLKDYINRNNIKIFIQVDGGINIDTLEKSKKHGATNFVSGSFLINNLDNKYIINQLKK